MTSIHAATIFVLFTRHRNSCDGDSCGDASSSPHPHQSHCLPAMIRKHHTMNTDSNIYSAFKIHEMHTVGMLGHESIAYR